MVLENQTFSDSLALLGEDTGNPITVRLSNEIVTLLSSQLYQSPLKAIEELVVNSYDANAKQCRLFVTDPSSDLQAILVYDDGIGMDTDGLSDLWLVARSKKREAAYQRRIQRKQIGKFGIGKLATYAVANLVTYVSRAGDDILAVSTDFRQFQEDSQGSSPISLPVTRISSFDSLKKSEVFCSSCKAAGVAVDSLMDRNHKSWTIVLLESMKPRTIHVGRLRWVLRTAMPLQPEFRLFLNRREVLSSKENASILVQFGVAELPSKRLDSVNDKTQEDWRPHGGSLKSSSFPEGVQGTVIVTRESLHVGKSMDLGRSHGFFVKVRRRLINAEDPLFGLSPLSYQTFNRFRADVTVDELDEAITAPREGIGESSLKDKLLPLLEELFYEARERYEKQIRDGDEQIKRKKEDERTYVPTRMLEHPIADVLSAPSSGPQQGAEGDESWFYLDVKEDQEITSLVQSLYSQNRRKRYTFSYTRRGKSARLVQFDPEQSAFYLNADHDLVLEYHGDSRSRALLEDVATAEAVLEVYLREHGVPPHVVGQVLEKRDSLLRGLANERLFSLAAISESLKDSASDEHDLEVALVAASRALGFVTKHVGGAGEPDGIGRFTDHPDGEQKITLEAKSSGGIPSLAHLDFAGLHEHVTKHEAAGCLLLAPRYPGVPSGENSAVSRRAKETRVSCWTVDQLARVVAAAESRHIGAQQVLDVVLKQFAPADVSTAVEKLLGEPRWEQPSLYSAILQALKRLENRLRDQPRTVLLIAAEVSGQPNFANILGREIKDALANLAAASQGALLLRDDRVIVNTSLEELDRRLVGMTGDGAEPRRGGTLRSTP